MKTQNFDANGANERELGKQENMNARKFVELHGKALIGKRVVTDAVGGYPGGVALVVGLYPDPNAPEIVCQVEHPTWRESGSGEIGIFDREQLGFA